MRLGTSHLAILTAIIASVIGTFFASNAITGLTIASDSVQNGDFAAITGRAVDSGSGLQTVTGGVLFSLAGVAALIVVARIGRNSITEARQREPDVATYVKAAEEAIQEGNHIVAYGLYGKIKSQYGTLEEKEKTRHYPRIMQIHRALSRQAAINEAQFLTEKYVSNTITQEEFERLKTLIASQ